MQKLFNNILVPIDFTSDAGKTLDKAIDLANEFKCNIFLLHVVPVSPFVAASLAEGHSFIPHHLAENKRMLEAQMKNLVSSADPGSDQQYKISGTVQSGNWNENVLDFITEQKIDLMMIGQKPAMFWKRKLILNPDLIAKKTNIPVITIPTNKQLKEFYSIIIPITDFLPIRKLMYGIYIASRHNARLKLLGIENSSNTVKVRHYLHKAYQLIRDNCTVAVDLEMVTSNNIADAISSYSNRHAADLIILNPEKQTRMPGFFSSVFGNIIQKYSGPPVLTVNPV